MDAEMEMARESQAELEFIADNIPVLVSYIDTDLKYRRINTRYEEFFGRSREEIIGRRVAEIVGEPHYSAALPNIQRALAGERVTFRSRIAHADGSLRDIEVTYTPDTAPGGAVRGFVTMGQDVTEQTRARDAILRSEQRLAARERHLQAVLDCVPECVMMLGPAGEIKEINTAGTQLLGVETAGQVIGEPLTQWVGEVHRQAVDRLISGALQAGISGRVQCLLQTTARGARLVEARFAPMCDETSKTVGVLCSMHDNTSRQQTEDALREANTKLSAIIESSPLPIVAFTREGDITLWNAAAERTFGWTENEVLGRPLPFIPEEKIEEHRRMRQQDLSGEGFQGREIRRRKKDGTPIDISVSTAPMRDASGRITGIMSLYLDVTEKRRMEHEVRESEAKFRALVEQSPLPTQIMSAGGKVVRANKAWERLWGISAEDIADLDVLKLPAVVARGIVPWLERALAGESVELPEMAFVPDRGTRKGEMIWVRGSAYAVRDENGDVDQVVVLHEDVTEWKRAEEALRESEQTSSLLMQALPALVWTGDAEGRFTFANHSWIAYTGQGLEAALGVGWQNVVHPNDREQTLQSWQAAMNSGEQYEVKHRLRRSSDGHWRWHVVRAFPVRNPEGRVVRWLGCSTDIHEQVDAAERLGFAMEASGMGGWSWDPRTDTITLSERAAEILGVSSDADLSWESMQKLYHPDDVARARREVIEAIEQRRSCDLEYRVITGLPLRWISAKGRAIYDADGSVQGMVGLIQDITERKMAEEERRELLAREQQARSTAEQLNSVGALLAAELDTRRLTQTITDAATQLTGAAWGAFFQKSKQDDEDRYRLYTLSGAPAEKFAGSAMPRKTSLFEATFQGEGAVRSDDITKDPRYGKMAPHHGMPEGHLPVCSYMAVPVVSRSGEVLGGLLFGHPERARFDENCEVIVRGIAGQAAIALDNARLFEDAEAARAELQQSNAELRRANAALEQFAYSASHDLQEPLRMVSIYCELLGRKYLGSFDAQGENCLRFAIEGAQRMEALVRDLLAYTRATAVVEPEEGIASPADAALNEALSNLDGNVREEGVLIERSPLPVLRVSHVHLVQLFQNLVGNALKYRSQEPLVVRIWAEQHRDKWKLCIEDNGIGIPPQYNRQIFGLFKRLHRRNEYPGTGLGLAICQKIVELYSGEIWVEPGPKGKGSRFCFTVPPADVRD